MKKLTYHFAALAGLILLNTSCENYDETKIPEKYHKVLVLQSAGEQDLTLYRTGEDSDYPMCIIKAGSEDGLSAKATLVIDQEWLEQYNEDNSKHFVILPSEYYSMETQSIQIAGQEKYKVVNVSFKTTQIDALINANPEVQYALPMRLQSDDTTISETNNYVILKPTVLVPTISFGLTGYQKTAVTTESSETVTIEIPVTLPLTNNWTFDCTVRVNKSLLDEYNQEKGTSYPLLLENTYTLEKTCSFVPGTNSATITLKVDRTKLSLGDYILPIELQSCSQSGFEIGSERVYLAGISYLPPQIPLSLAMLSSNATVEGDGTGLTGLFDGLGSGKHYHSNYSGSVVDPIYGHYIDFHLSTPITYVMFDYFTRFENGNGAPTEIVLYTKTDDTEWTKLTTVTQGLPKGGNMEYQSNIYESDNPFTYLRFSVTKSVAGDVTSGSSYFNLGELSLYGQ